MNKKYSTFEEIDRDLRILKLQADISKEELKLAAKQTKESLTPTKMIAGIAGGVAVSTVLIKLLTPIAAFGIGKFLKRYK